MPISDEAQQYFTQGYSISTDPSLNTDQRNTQLVFLAQSFITNSRTIAVRHASNSVIWKDNPELMAILLEELAKSTECTKQAKILNNAFYCYLLAKKYSDAQRCVKHLIQHYSQFDLEKLAHNPGNQAQAPLYCAMIFKEKANDLYEKEKQLELELELCDFTETARLYEAATYCYVLAKDKERAKQCAQLMFNEINPAVWFNEYQPSKRKNTLYLAVLYDAAKNKLASKIDFSTPTEILIRCFEYAACFFAHSGEIDEALSLLVAVQFVSEGQLFERFHKKVCAKHLECFGYERYPDLFVAAIYEASGHYAKAARHYAKSGTAYFDFCTRCITNALAEGLPWPSNEKLESIKAELPLYYEAFMACQQLAAAPQLS